LMEFVFGFALAPAIKFPHRNPLAILGMKFVTRRSSS